MTRGAALEPLWDPQIAEWAKVPGHNVCATRRSSYWSEGIALASQEPGQIYSEHHEGPLRELPGHELSPLPEVIEVLGLIAEPSRCFGLRYPQLSKEPPQTLTVG